MEGLIAPWHIAIVLVIALFVFGPKKLPQMGHSLGQSISGFRKGLQEAKDEFSGVMTEGPGNPAESHETSETKVAAGSPAPAAPLTVASAEPTVAASVAETIEQPAAPAVKL